MKSMGIATNDVSNFVKKQTIHKRVNQAPDTRVQRIAMHSKLADAIAFASRLRRERDMLKKRVSKKYSGSTALGRRLLEESMLLQQGFIMSDKELLGPEHHAWNAYCIVGIHVC